MTDMVNDADVIGFMARGVLVPKREDDVMAKREHGQLHKGRP